MFILVSQIWTEKMKASPKKRTGCPPLQICVVFSSVSSKCANSFTYSLTVVGELFIQFCEFIGTPIWSHTAPTTLLVRHKFHFIPRSRNGWSVLSVLAVPPGWLQVMGTSEEDPYVSCFTSAWWNDQEKWPTHVLGTFGHHKSFGSFGEFLRSSWLPCQRVWRRSSKGHGWPG